MNKETEIKAKVPSSKIEALRERIIELGAVPKNKVRQTDIYFTAPHKDFLKSKECLRIRKENDHREITYKGPSNKFMEKRAQFWKKEINVPLSCSVKEIQDLLRSLGFKEVTRVIKQREILSLGKNIITLDKVKSLGWFIEIERSVSTKRDQKKAIQENLGLLKKLGLAKKDVIPEPYRDLVIKRNG